MIDEIKGWAALVLLAIVLIDLELFVDRAIYRATGEWPEG